MSHLDLEEPSNATDLRIRIEGTLGWSAAEFKIAVEALLFTEKQQWVLIRRGGSARDEVGKLEGIGGRIHSDDLRGELLREIGEEVGEDVQVEIRRFLEVKTDEVTHDGRTQKWVIVSYLCERVAGELKVMEPEKNEGFVFVDSLQVDPTSLSSSCRQSYETLREHWPELQRELAAEGM